MPLKWKSLFIFVTVFQLLSVKTLAESHLWPAEVLNIPSLAQLSDLLDHSFHFELSQARVGWAGFEYSLNANSLVSHRKLSYADLSNPKALIDFAGEMQKMLNQYALPPSEIFEYQSQFLVLKRKIQIYQELVATGRMAVQPEMAMLAALSEKKLKDHAIATANVDPRVQDAALAQRNFQKDMLDLSLSAVSEKVASLYLRNDLAIPAPAQNFVKQEQTANDFMKIRFYFSSANTTLHLAFRAPEQNVFDLLFIKLNAKEVEALGLKGSVFESAGEFIFFIHPQSLNFFKKLIKNHELHSGIYAATALSSSRSLVIWKQTNPQEIFLAKVGLDADISGVYRIVEAAEVMHARIVSEGLAQIPESYFRRIRFAPFMESSGIIPNGWNSGVIGRSKDSALGSLFSFQPVFSLFADNGQGVALIQTLAQNAGKSVERYAMEDFLPQIIGSLAKLYSDYGFIIEPHTQNLLVKIENGKVAAFGFRDLSGVAIDTSLRLIRGLKNDFITVRTSSPNFSTKYHEARGITYLNKAVEEHFKMGFLEAFMWIPGQSQDQASELYKKLVDFTDQEFRKAFKATAGAEIQGKEWADSVRKGLQKQRKASCERAWL